MAKKWRYSSELQKKMRTCRFFPTDGSVWQHSRRVQSFFCTNSRGSLIFFLQLKEEGNCFFPSANLPIPTELPILEAPIRALQCQKSSTSIIQVYRFPSFARCKLEPVYINQLISDIEYLTTLIKQRSRLYILPQFELICVSLHFTARQDKRLNDVTQIPR